tara:strand:- start:14 stop:238 length:225 start_codon:yes stop_codon:yes gene_type:complete
LKNDRYIETKTIARVQEEINEDILLKDELILEILLPQNLSRVSRVAILIELRKCNVEDGNNFNICTEQFQAIYN